MNLFQLTQVIEEPTRFTSNTQTPLDLFIINKPENIINSGVVHLGSMTIVSYLVVENYLCVRISLKFLKHEIISIINPLSFS